MEYNRIYHEDCKSTLAKMVNQSIDLVLTSPPYNVDLGNNKYNKTPYNLYIDNKEHRLYIKWLEDIFSLAFVKTKKGGRCVINIGDGQNGRVPTHSDVIQMMTSIGWIPLTTIIWDKNNASSRTAWGSFKSPSAPSFPTPFEYILAFAKEDKKLQWKGDTDLTNEEFIDWSLAKWKFSGEDKRKIGHPAPFPIELPIRCIKMFTWIGSLVYDPFMGSGTTALACLETRRDYVGSEISKEYIEIASKRIADKMIREGGRLF